MTLEKDTVEKISDNPLTTLASTTVGTVGGFFIGGPLGAVLGALLPVLTNIPAHKRAEKRINSIEKDIKRICDENPEKLHELNDAQYKILTETILTIFQTIEENKLDSLRRIVRNTIIGNTEITHHESAPISRIIRDISADEAIFLVNNSHYLKIVIKHYEYEIDTKENTVLYIDATDEKISIVNGLVNLGLLSATPAGVGGVSVDYVFSTIATKLKKLLNDEH